MWIEFSSEASTKVKVNSENEFLKNPAKCIDGSNFFSEGDNGNLNTDLYRWCEAKCGKNCRTYSQEQGNSFSLKSPLSLNHFRDSNPHELNQCVRVRLQEGQCPKNLSKTGNSLQREGKAQNLSRAMPIKYQSVVFVSSLFSLSSFTDLFSTSFNYLKFPSLSSFNYRKIC